MRISTKTKLLPLIALMLVMGVFSFAGTAALAADPPTDAETLTVDEVWLVGDTLHITVTDKNGGESHTLELSLSDYAMSGDEYVTIQATDGSGNMSNAIQFKNPYYSPTSEPPQPNNGQSGDETALPDDGGGEAPLPDETGASGRPFTPDGTGTVVDNATDGDGKEFFTVETPDGNVFYLIVDRQRTSENVYLLNAVTEDDLASLAKPGDGLTTGAATAPPSITPTPEPPEPSEPETPAPESSGGGNGTIIIIVIAVLAVGGAGYYFKIVRPKQNGGDAYDDEEYEDFDENEEIDVADDGEGDDEE